MSDKTFDFPGARIDASAPCEIIDDILRVARFHYDRRAEQQVALLLKKLETELIDKHKRVLWEVCQGYGKAGECVYITFNHKVGGGDGVSD